MAMKKLEFHDAALIFPLMIDERIDDLADNIKQSGLREAIKLFDGKILDGRNRYLACLRAGVKPRTEEAKLGGMSPTQYSLDMNLQRRHLKESQLAMVGTKALASFEKEAEKNLHLSKGHGVKKGGAPGPQVNERGPRSRDKLAATLGISGRTVARAKRVKAKGIPELTEAVESGEILMAPAEKIAKLPKEEQAQALADAKKKKVDPAKDKEIMARLMLGESRLSISKVLSVPYSRVERLYTERAVPELLKTDWLAEANSSLIKEMSIAKNRAAVDAECSANKIAGGWQKLAIEKAGVGSNLLVYAVCILSYGCRALVSRAETGDITLSAANLMAKLPHEEQIEKLKETERKRNVDVVDELRFRASTMLDQKIGFQQIYDKNGAAIREFLKVASKEEIREVTLCFKSVSEWSAMVFGILKGE